jgi:ammonia channel protein AmtB
MGALDFVGGTVVHISSGISALAAALVVGRRFGYGSIAYIPHNLPMTITGAALLWFGWFGFNIFYVRDLEGQKIEDENQLIKIEKALLHRIGDGRA